MYIDRIDLTLPEADITSLLSSFLSAEEKLQALPSVSKGDRKRYAKLGLKNEGLALQIIEVGRYNPDVIPRGINFEQIDRDLVARNQLRTLKLALERLLGMVEDSMLLTGVDIYAAALSIYHCLRRNAETTSLREVVEELKRGFARPSRKKKVEVEASPAAPTPDPVTPLAPQVMISAASPLPHPQRISSAPHATVQAIHPSRRLVPARPLRLSELENSALQSSRDPSGPEQNTPRTERFSLPPVQAYYPR